MPGYGTSTASKRKLLSVTATVMIVAIALWVFLPEISKNTIVNTLIATIAMMITLELSLKF